MVWVIHNLSIAAFFSAQRKNKQN